MRANRYTYDDKYDHDQGVMSVTCPWSRCPGMIREYRDGGFKLLSKTQRPDGTVEIKFRKPKVRETVS